MSFPHKRTEVTDDCGVSSPDDNDNTSADIHQEARLLEETEEPLIPVGNASDADVSDSGSSIKTTIDAEISREQQESLEKLSETYHKLQKSPKKKPYRRSKYDSNIHGEPSTRDDDSSDEEESTYLEKSPKKVRYALKEEMTDNVAGTSYGTSQNPNSNLIVQLDSERLDSSNDSSSKENCADNKSIINTSRTAEIVSTMPEGNVDSNAEAAGFTLVRTSDLITEAVSNSISNQERIPQAGTSNEVTETTEHAVDSKTYFAAKAPTRSRHSGAYKLFPQEGNNSELTAAVSNPFSQVQGTVSEGPSVQTTAPCSSQTVDLLKTEHSEDSNISTETMDFICESSTDRVIETNADVEKMDYSSESCGGFENAKSGSEYSAGVEKMEFLCESSINHDEVEMESASAKSTDNEGMDYISESVLLASESVYPSSESVYPASESVYPASESVYPASESVLSASESIAYKENVCTSNEGKTVTDSNMVESVNTEREYIPPSLIENELAISIESDSNSNEVTNINESNSDETIHINRKFSIPRVESSDTEEYEYKQNQGVINDADSIIISTASTSATRPVAEIVPRVIIEEPSNTEGKPSFKRKKSSDDSDNGTEGGTVPNVTESTDTQIGTAASSIEFPDTDSDEFQERIYTKGYTKSKESPRKFRKK